LLRNPFEELRSGKLHHFLVAAELQTLVAAELHTFVATELHTFVAAEFHAFGACDAVRTQLHGRQLLALGAFRNVGLLGGLQCANERLFLDRHVWAPQNLKFYLTPRMLSYLAGRMPNFARREVPPLPQ
jgi:hypothetical protein